MGSNSDTRRFEYKDDKSSKFWEIHVEGNGFTVRYGKIGTDGQTQTKEFADAATAEKQSQKLIAEKVGKGYVEVGAGATAPAAIETPAQPKAKAEQKPVPQKSKPVKALKPEDIAKDPESPAEALEPLAGSSEAIDRLIAKHPKAGATLLEKLSHSSDKTTRKSVCLNPNTPKETLIRLAPQFPSDFFQNPAFDWLLLEDPNLLFDIGGGVLKNILKRPECPVSFLKWAVGHGNEQEQLAAAMNPQTPVESLRSLLKSKHASVVAAAKGHAALADEQTTPETDPEAAFLTGIAEALANLSEEEAVDLWKRDYLGDHHVPALASEVAFKTMGGNALICKALTYPQPLTILEVMAKNKDATVRSAAASNKNCSASLLLSLGKDESWLVKAKVASNPNCPLELLERLAKDKEIFVRRSAVSNPNCPEALLEVFCKSTDAELRLAAASNPKCPVTLRDSVLENLAKKGNTFEVAASPNCSASLLDALAKRKWGAPKHVIAANPNCSLSLLDVLSKEDDNDVRGGVAANPNCPTSLLESLAKDKSHAVRVKVAANPNCSVPLRDSLLNALATNKVTDIRRAVAANPNCPGSLLEVLAKDDDSSVRHAVAINPTCPASLLERLTNDKHANPRLSALARNEKFVASLATPEGRLKWIERARRLRQDEADLTLLSPTPTLEKKGENHNNALIRALAFCRSDVAVEALAKNQKHVSWLVRAAIARNRNCPETVLMALEKDSHQVVAGLARRSNSQSANTQDGITDRINKLREVRPDTRLLLDAIAQSLGKINAPANPSIYNLRMFIEETSKMPTSLQHWLPPKTKFHLLSPVYDLRRNLASNPGCPVVFLEELAKDKDSYIRRRVAAHPNCPETTLALLAKDKELEVREAVASHSNSPVSLLETLAKDKHFVVRRAVSGNLNCPAALLETLSKDDENEVLGAVACNPNCPDKLRKNLWKIIVKDTYYGVREGVAANLNCPVSWLESLSKEESVSLRKAVAANPRCPTTLLETLALDKERSVLWTVAANPNCTVAVLEVLSKDADEDSSVRDNVASNPNCTLPLLEVLAKDNASRVREAVALNPNCSLSLLEDLAKSHQSSVRGAVAANLICPLLLRNSLLECLVKEKDKWARRRVAGNPMCPEALLRLLLTDESDDVRSEVASNPNCPENLLHEIMDKSQLEILAMEAPPSPLTLEDCVYPGCPPKLKLLAALQPDCPKEQLFKSANSSDPLERLAAALNPMLPTAQVMRLLDDPDINVQRAAARHPNCKLGQVNQ